MKRRNRCAVFGLLLGWCACGAIVARGQAAASAVPAPAAAALPVAPSPNELDQAKQAQDAGSYAGPLLDYVKAQVTRMTAGDAAAQSAAREALIAGIAPVHGSQPTPDYIDKFCIALSAGLAPAQDSPTMRVRMDAAIVLARVGEHAESSSNRLQEPVAKAMTDPQDAVAFWGIRAAKPLIPVVLGNTLMAQGSPLLAKINELVKDTKRSGLVVAELYNTLAQRKVANKKVTTAVEQQMLVPMLELFTRRVGEWKQHLPQQPAAETVATSYLALQDVWQTAATPAQRVTAMQDFSDLLASASQQLAAAPPTGAEELVSIIREVGGDLYLVAGNSANSALTKVTDPLHHLPRGAGAAAVAPLVEKVYAAIITDPAMKSVTPPATGGAPTTGPTTAVPTMP